MILNLPVQRGIFSLFSAIAIDINESITEERSIKGIQHFALLRYREARCTVH